MSRKILFGIIIGMIGKRLKKIQFALEDIYQSFKLIPKLASKDIKEKRLRRKPEHFLDFPDYLSWRKNRKKELGLI